MNTLERAKQLKAREIFSIRAMSEEAMFDNEELYKLKDRLFSVDEKEWFENVKPDSEEWQEIRDMQHDVVEFAEEILELRTEAQKYFQKLKKSTRTLKRA